MILDSERSEETGGFTMVFVFYYLNILSCIKKFLLEGVL